MQRVEPCGIVGNEIPGVIKSSSRKSKVSTGKAKDFMVSAVMSFAFFVLLHNQSYSADAGLIFCS